MGACLSKKKGPQTPTQTPTPTEPPKSTLVASEQAEPPPVEKKPVFIITQNKKSSSSSTSSSAAATTLEEDDKKGETPRSIDVGAAPENARPVPMRTSSCTREELDAILIQCGRLSRSASGKASSDALGARKYSGSKRSYDFDERRREDEEEWEKPVYSRPSPQRRTPSRGRDRSGECKRSGSRERASGDGRRRVSRSPGRRSDGPTPSGDRSKQPAKMVSVPAREKGGVATAETGGAAKRATPALSKPRCQSPRSQSPANNRPSNENSHHNTHPQPLSRSSSRKAEQSPHRRNPMAELDDNSLVVPAEQHPLRKPSQSQSQKASEGLVQVRNTEQRCGRAGEIPNGIKSNNAITDCVREQLMSCRAKEQPVEPEGGMKGAEALLGGAEGTRKRSSRRPSRDLDNSLGFPNAYDSLLLEGIHTYPQQNTAFSLPACVSKACCILDAVADLNSFSDNKSYEGARSDNSSTVLNGQLGRRGLAANEPFVESEIVVKDDLMEPSLHRYVTVRDWGGELEPQESAGSNSVIGQPWASPWGHNSVDSTGRRSNATGEEVVEEEEFSPMEQQQLQHRQQQVVPDASARRVRAGSSTISPSSAMTSGSKKRESHHRQVLRRGNGVGAFGNAKAGGRGLSIPVAAAASS